MQHEQRHATTAHDATTQASNTHARVSTHDDEHVHQAKRQSTQRPRWGRISARNTPAREFPARNECMHSEIFALSRAADLPWWELARLPPPVLCRNLNRSAPLQDNRCAGPRLQNDARCLDICLARGPDLILDGGGRGTLLLDFGLDVRESEHAKENALATARSRDTR